MTNQSAASQVFAISELVAMIFEYRTRAIASDFSNEEINECQCEIPERLLKILEQQNKIEWDSISKNQTLSEEFIERHKDRVNWGMISYAQTLSEEFIERHKDRVNWGMEDYWWQLDFAHQVLS
jgi:hypothetical protein